MKKEHLYYLDLIKAMAIAMVVVLHIPLYNTELFLKETFPAFSNTAFI